MSKPLTVAALWDSYLSEVVPKKAMPNQIIETERAFYAGANALFRMIINRLESGEEPTEADLKFIDEINNELVAFVKNVKNWP